MEDKRRMIIDILEDVTGADGFEDLTEVDLFEEGILDSLAFLEIIVEVENRCGVHIEPTEVEREDMNTIEKITSYIQEKSL